MFIPPSQGAAASTGSSAGGPTPAEPIRHMLFGTPQAIQATIRQLHKQGYAEPNDWSRLMSTGRANEVMAILTKRIRIE